MTIKTASGKGVVTSAVFDDSQVRGRSDRFPRALFIYYRRWLILRTRVFFVVNVCYLRIRLYPPEARALDGKDGVWYIDPTCNPSVLEWRSHDPVKGSTISHPDMRRGVKDWQAMWRTEAHQPWGPEKATAVLKSAEDPCRPALTRAVVGNQGPKHT